LPCSLTDQVSTIFQSLGAKNSVEMLPGIIVLPQKKSLASAQMIDVLERTT